MKLSDREILDFLESCDTLRITKVDDKVEVIFEQSDGVQGVAGRCRDYGLRNTMQIVSDTIDKKKEMVKDMVIEGFNQ